MNITITGHTPWRLFIGPNEAQIIKIEIEDEIPETEVVFLDRMGTRKEKLLPSVSNLQATSLLEFDDLDADVVTIRSESDSILWTGTLLQEKKLNGKYYIVAKGYWGVKVMPELIPFRERIAAQMPELLPPPPPPQYSEHQLREQYIKLQFREQDIELQFIEHAKSIAKNKPVLIGGRLYVPARLDINCIPAFSICAVFWGLKGGWVLESLEKYEVNFPLFGKDYEPFVFASDGSEDPLKALINSLPRCIPNSN